jgi:hypothetical protein
MSWERCAPRAPGCHLRVYNDCLHCNTLALSKQPATCMAHLQAQGPSVPGWTSAAQSWCHRQSCIEHRRCTSVLQTGIIVLGRGVQAGDKVHMLWADLLVSCKKTLHFTHANTPPQKCTKTSSNRTCAVWLPASVAFLPATVQFQMQEVGQR